LGWLGLGFGPKVWVLHLQPSEEKQLQSMSHLLADITMHKNIANTRMWGGEATYAYNAYTVKFESELIDNIFYLGNSPHSYLLWK